MNIVDIAIAKSHTNSTVIGLGAIKGSPCVIKSTTKTATGNDVVFEWTSTTGTTETSTMKVKDGLDITGVEVNSDNTITCTLSDGSTITSTNSIKVVNGKDGLAGKNGVDGKSAYEIAKVNGFSGTEQEWLKGLNGNDGVGIAKIEKIATVNLVDTYQITFTDNSTFEYDIKNGSDNPSTTEEFTIIEAIL